MSSAAATALDVFSGRSRQTWTLAGLRVEGEDALRVLGQPDDRVHLGSPRPPFLGERRERLVRPLRAVGGRLGRGGLPPGLVADLAAQLGVGHAGVARRYPAVYRRGVNLEPIGAAAGYLGGREAPGHVRPDRRHGPLEVVLLGVHAPARP